MLAACPSGAAEGMMARRDLSGAPWALAAGIWGVYGTAALTEGLMVFHPDGALTGAVFRHFAETVDASYQGHPFGDALHRAFAVVDTLFGPLFCAAGVGLVRNRGWGAVLAFSCALTSLALLTVDLLADAFGGFHNVLSPWAYGLAFVPYYVVATLVLRHALPRWKEGLEESRTSAFFSRRAAAFLVDGAVALALSAVATGGWLLAVAYLLLRDGLYGGRSLGKWVFGLRVVEREGGAAVGVLGSLWRNVVFALPWLGTTISVAVFEGAIVYFDGEGLRSGDRIAGTRVIRA